MTLFNTTHVLVNISGMVQFHVPYFKSSLPGQTRGSVIMGGIKTIMFEAHVSEILEHVRP